MDTRRPTRARERRRFLGVLAGVGVSGGLMAHSSAATGLRVAQRRIYLGAYTKGADPAPGIGLANMDLKTGALTLDGTVEGVDSPSFLALSPSGQTLYAVNELPEGRVSAFAVEREGLRFLNHRSTQGAGPCHLSVHPSGRYLLTANYGSGNVVVHPINADGSLAEAVDLIQHTGSGPHPKRQQKPHPHMVMPDPTGRRALVADLGNDSVYVYRFDLVRGRLTIESQLRTQAGAGPRHLAFHPSERTVYVINELDSTIITCGYDPTTGALTAGQTASTLPKGTTVSNEVAEVLMSPNGRFVLVSNRGHDSIAVFNVDRPGYALRLRATYPCGGKTPRHMSFDATHRFLLVANQGSGLITTFRANHRTGELTPTGHTLATPSPACVLPG